MQLVSLQKAPWLGLSLLVHVVGTVLIILLIPEPGVVAPGLHVNAQLEEEEPDILLEPSVPELIELRESPEDELLLDYFPETTSEVEVPTDPPPV